MNKEDLTVLEIKEYYEGTDLVRFKREEYLDGSWDEYTYDENGWSETFKDSSGFSSKCTYDKDENMLTYESSSGYYEIKGYQVTKEEYEAFTNPKPLTAKQKAHAYIYLFGEYEVFFRVEEMIKGLKNNVKYKHLLEVQNEIMSILNLDSCGDKIK